MRKIFLLWMAILFPLSCLFGQADITDQDKKGGVESLFDLADRVIDFVSSDTWTFIPALTYSPETSLGVGARAIKLFRPKSNQDSLTRPSSFPITFLYTLNHQALLTSELNFWEKGNKGYLNARLEFANYPFKFYGLGRHVQAEEIYATRYAYFHVNYEKRIAPGLYIGPRYESRVDDIYQTAPGGLLESGQISGSAGQRLSGLGLAVNYDTRDHIFQPQRGVFHQLTYMSFAPFLGSNFTFDQLQLDLRKYISIKPGQVLAGQAWLSFTGGSPPFQHVSLIGGSDRMRGYFEGKYRDLHAMVYQAEYRLHVYRNLGVVFFGSAGQISPDVKSFGFRHFRYGGGLGFRYKLNDEGLNVRLDIGFGDQSAFYFGLNEVL